MENKYYTPTIEEFHVGFEFEWKYRPDGSWEKSTQEYCDPGLFDNGDGEHPFEYQLSDVGIRVKCLDREDIESLGWNFTGKSIDIWFDVEGVFDLGTWTSYKMRLQYGLHDMRLKIYASDTGADSGHVLFQGTIKNKSELRKIMNQVGIKTK